MIESTSLQSASTKASAHIAAPRPIPPSAIRLPRPSRLLPLESIPVELQRATNGNGRRGRVSALFPYLNILRTAAKVPCSESCLHNVLHGKRQGTVELLQKVAKVLNMTLDDLLTLQAKAKRAAKRASASAASTIVDE